MAKIKAIGFTGDCGLNDKDAFVEFEQDMPVATGNDILVEIKAVSVNPLDTKVRGRLVDKTPAPSVLGWDASGVVTAIGERVTFFNVGEEVYYSGSVLRSGTNTTHQLVDERLVGIKPKKLSFEEAAALPLTAITAWESIFDRLGVNPEKDQGKSIFIIGGAGGVGSIAIQLAKNIANLKVVTTASRKESKQWCLDLGADVVLNHNEDLLEQYKQAELTQPHYILCLNSSDQHFHNMSEIILPQGTICCIVDFEKAVNFNVLKTKSVGLVWEFMMTRAMYETDDMVQQHQLLDIFSSIVDEGAVKSTLKNMVGELTVDNLVKAHALLEKGNTIGKVVLKVS